MRLLIASCLLFSSSYANAQESKVVVPSSTTNVDGNNNNVAPFGIRTHRTMRYQQIYSATEFERLGKITQLSFRVDGGLFIGFTPTISIANIQISLSTSSREPDELSATFAENIGSDNTLVYDGSLTLTSDASGFPMGAREFDVHIDLQTPFDYNPNLGNLLLDVSNFSGGTGNLPLDAEEVLGDSISRIFAHDVNATEGTASLQLAPTRALVTQFTVVIPEPSTILLAAVATIGLGHRRTIGRVR